MSLDRQGPRSYGPARPHRRDGPTLATSIPVADVYDEILDGAGRSLLR